MKSVVDMFSIILLKFKAKKRVLKIKCSKKNLNFLNLLCDLNVLEYSSIIDSKDTYLVKLKYYRSKPTLKSFVYIGLKGNGNLPKESLVKDLNSKKSTYIVMTSDGLSVISDLSSKSNIKLILFKLNLV